MWLDVTQGRRTIKKAELLSEKKLERPWPALSAGAPGSELSAQARKNTAGHTVL